MKTELAIVFGMDISMIEHREYIRLGRVAYPRGSKTICGTARGSVKTHFVQAWDEWAFRSSSS